MIIGESLKVSKQLRYLLECNNWLRLWVISFNFSVISDETSMDFKDLIKFKRSKHIVYAVV